uniref:Wsv270-like protein n=1 Tax=Melicertus latisulcatus pemonivirus TaxID=2984278 RepID=A0A9C7C642_9VIRU|nr:MAG: wsv270-like protein [Melicertus latisulcatus pemonivirus]
MHRIFVAIDCEEPVPVTGRDKDTDDWQIDIAWGCLIDNLESLSTYNDIVILGCTSGDIAMNRPKLDCLSAIARHTLDLPVIDTLVVSTRTGRFLGRHMYRQPIDRIGDVLICSDRLSTRGLFIRGPAGETSTWLDSAAVNSAGLLAGNVWIGQICSNENQKCQRKKGITALSLSLPSS